MNIINDDYSPVFQGDTLQPFSPQFATHSNGVPTAFDLSGLTISMKMVNETGTNTITCSGIWTIDDPVNGLAHYNYASADVATPGLWTMYIKLTNTGTGAFVHAMTKTLEILASP